MRKFTVFVQACAVLALFAVSAQAQPCPLTAETHLFITSAPPDAEKDKNPIRVNSSGGPVRSYDVPCQAQQLSFNFFAAHYAQDPGTAMLTITVKDSGGKLIAQRDIPVNNQIRAWQDLRNVSVQQKYSDTITLPKNATIGKVELSAVPGNWALVINGLTINLK
ncbi:exported hypothetical protein [uncultured Gammaproteobacteria bacterium]